MKSCNLFKLLSLLACVIPAAHARPSRQSGLSQQQSFHQRRLWNRVLVDDLWKFDLGDDDPNPKHDHLVQPLSHFDPMVNVTFRQYYWIVSQYWMSPSNPVFLYIGGEDELSSDEVAYGHHVEMAKQHGALILGVEHRFYGKSIPRDGMKPSMLQYLCSEQELADLATFHDFAKNKFSLTNNTWLVFGGSYAGALSSWFRMKFPHLVYASVASSAPVRAATNFHGYNDVVHASLGNPVALGSKECVGNVTEAYGTVGKMARAGQQAQLQKDFNTCQDLTNPLDVENMAFSMSIDYMVSVQYNTVTGNYSDIKESCLEIMGPDPYQLLVKKYKNPSQCSDVSFESNVEVTKEAELLWYHQKCTEFGYFKTCNTGSSCIFGDLVHLDYFYETCKEVYNLDSSKVIQQVNFTNTYYGADNPMGSRVVFVNGGIDPWHSLSVLQDLPGDIKTVFMKSTSHCEDMQPSSTFDNDELKNGRKAIESIVSDWLKQAETEKSRQVL